MGSGPSPVGGGGQRRPSRLGAADYPKPPPYGLNDPREQLLLLERRTHRVAQCVVAARSVSGASRPMEGHAMTSCPILHAAE